ncbi:MAG: hypothetical protein DWQ02_08270 [Bacteroidetes bacterium]|nr:MAG: hypothetical protein DWQ02_08270 [Bacteroidota bacterium]
MRSVFRLICIPFMLIGQLIYAQNHFIVFEGSNPRTYIIINEKGEEVAQLPDGWKGQNNVADIGFFDEGYHIVYKMVDNKRVYRLMDTVGQIIEPEIPIDYYTKMSDGLIAVKTGGKAGYMNASGEVVIPLQFQFAYDFHEGLARVKVNSKFGLIDKQGNYVLPPEFRDVANISEGVIFAAKNAEEFAFYDSDGNQVIPETEGYSNPHCYSCGRVFKGGLYRVREKEGDYLFGYINKNGEVVIEPRFNAAFDFINGITLVKEGEMFGYIDTTGAYVIPPKYQHAQQFYINSTWVRESKGEPYGMIDREGNYLIEPRFKSIPYRRHDLWMASVVDNEPASTDGPIVIGNYDVSKIATRVLYNDQGKEVFSVKNCTNLRPLTEDLFVVEWIKNRGSVAYSIINTKGEIIWQSNPQYFYPIGVNVIGYYEPEEIVQMDLSRRKRFDLDKMNLPVFASELWTFTNLKSLKLNGHFVVNLPKEIGRLKNLESLDLTDTHLEKLPAELFELKQLKKLKLDYNFNLKELPRKFFKHMQHLEELSIVRCGFSPDQVYEIRKKMEHTRVIYK